LRKKLKLGKFCRNSETLWRHTVFIFQYILHLWP